MKSIHLERHFAHTACGRDAISALETYDVNKVTCESCKKTNEFKRLKSKQNLQNEVKQIGVDAMEKKTYTQNIEIEVPIGWDFVKLGMSYQGDFYVDDKTDEVVQHIASGDFPFKLKIIVKPKVKTGAELIGHLVSTGDTLKFAEQNAGNLIKLGIVDAYNLSKHASYRINGVYHQYAYPVPLEKLNQLIKELQK